jgi:hypothetical protein
MGTLRPGRFTIDDDAYYAGYTYDERWNGWSCPYFSAEVANAIMADWNARQAPAGTATYDPATDTYTFADAEDPADWEPYTVQGETHLIDGQPLTLYAIGSSYWTWGEETA